MRDDLCRIGIIDIGSNSIRLVIYDTTQAGGYKIIKECKYSARLSEKITKEGRLEKKDMDTIIPVLQQFKEICDDFEVERIRAGATAAIRNAANSAEIISYLSETSSIPIEVVSGYQEAYFGFLGVINAFDVQDGFVIDIGGAVPRLPYSADGVTSRVSRSRSVRSTPIRCSARVATGMRISSASCNYT